MSDFCVAGFQMDVEAGDPAANVAQVLEHAEQAASVGAQLAVFPECVLTGYCYDDLDQAVANSIASDSPLLEQLAKASQELDIAICCGTLWRESDASTVVRNSVLTFYQGKCIDTYHKIHLPFLGVDRFVTSGSSLHEPIEIDGAKIGIHICYEGGFPEVARALALQGADLVLLPTNWPPGSGTSCQLIPGCRALENRVYFMAVNRVGSERGTDFIGHSSFCDVTGEVLASADHDQPAMLLETIDLERARTKRLIIQPGKYEIDRIGDRHPQLYGRLLEE